MSSGQWAGREYVMEDNLQVYIIIDQNWIWVTDQFIGGLKPFVISYNESIYYDRAFHTQDILAVLLGRARATF